MQICPPHRLLLVLGGCLALMKISLSTHFKVLKSSMVELP
jgi:hypothetical protein